MGRSAPAPRLRPVRSLTGWATIVSSAAYIASDVMELLTGGFSATQLYLTYAAFAPVPFVMVGLHASQRPRAGWLSLLGALAYGASFVFFAATAIYAIVAKTSDYAMLVSELGRLYVAHGALLIVGGVLFGVAAVRAGVFPRWTGLVLLAGVGLTLLVGLLPVPEAGPVAANATRNVAFIGMGLTLVRRPEERASSAAERAHPDSGR